MQILDILLDLVLIVVPFLIWYYKGRNRDIFPSFEQEPPESIIPSEIGYISDGHVDDKDVATILLHWAESGIIRIVDGNDFRIEKLTDLPSSARNYEKYFFGRLFPDGNTSFSGSRIKELGYGTVRRIRKAIVKSFTTDPERMLFSADRLRYTLLVGLIATLPVAKLLAFELIILHKTFKFNAGITIAVSALILISLYFISILLAKPSRLRSRYSGRFIAASLILSTAVGIALTAFLLIGGGSSGYRYVLSVICSFVIIMLLNMMMKRTNQGDFMYEHMLGFKNYIINTNFTTIEHQDGSPADIYFKVLPFAVSLGVSRQWAAHFDGLRFDYPQWFIPADNRRITAAEFDRRLIGMLREIKKGFNKNA